LSFPRILIREGKVKLFIPDPNYFKDEEGRFDPTYAPVFYNPRMTFCRDIGVLAVQAFQRLVERPIRICDPLAATGIRGLRYASEVDGVEYVLLNDVNPKAAELAIENVKLNNLESLVDITCSDARLILLKHSSPKTRFDVIDVDPFGSPVPFIESSIRALRDGGLLCLTATDMPPLCGKYPLTCLRKYGGLPLKVDFCHEIAVRLLVACLVKKAAEADFAARVVFSHSTDHYIRVYAILERNATKANELLKWLGYVIYCRNCYFRDVIRGVASPIPSSCPECNSPLLIGGPMWCGFIFEKSFVERMLEASSEKELENAVRVSRLLEVILEEVGGPPTYFILDAIASRLRRSSPPVGEVIKKLRQMGFFASRTHFHPKGVRTNAPLSKIYEAFSSCQLQ